MKGLKRLIIELSVILLIFLIANLCLGQFTQTQLFGVLIRNGRIQYKPRPAPHADTHFKELMNQYKNVGYSIKDLTLPFLAYDINADKS